MPLLTEIFADAEEWSGGVADLIDLGASQDYVPVDDLLDQRELAKRLKRKPAYRLTWEEYQIVKPNCYREKHISLINRALKQGKDVPRDVLLSQPACMPAVNKAMAMEAVDRDGDGLIYDGTKHEQPARPKPLGQQFGEARKKLLGEINEKELQLEEIERGRNEISQPLEEARKSREAAYQAKQEAVEALRNPGETNQDVIDRIGRAAIRDAIEKAEKETGLKELDSEIEKLKRKLKHFDVMADAAIKRRNLRELKRKLHVANIATTKEFQEWFGDSKTIGPDGLPLVIYHGTKTPVFTEFEESSGRDTGIFGSTDIHLAASYSGGYSDDVTPTLAKDWSDLVNMVEDGQLLTSWGNEEIGYGFDEDEAREKAKLHADNEEVHEYYELLDREGNLHTESRDKDDILDEYNTYAELRVQGSGEGVYPLFYALKNPMIYDAEGRNWDDVLGGGFESTRSLAREAEFLGADGVIFLNVVDSGARGYWSPGDVYVSFQAHNVKSIHNAGDFSPKTDDILKSYRGDIRDHDGDGLIYDGTKYERPAPAKDTEEITVQEINGLMDDLIRISPWDFEKALSEAERQKSVSTRQEQRDFFRRQIARWTKRAPAYKLTSKEFIRRESGKEVEQLMKDREEKLRYFRGILESGREKLTEQEVSILQNEYGMPSYIHMGFLKEALWREQDSLDGEVRRSGTIGDYIRRLREGRAGDFNGDMNEKHAKAVERAFAEGKKVPDVVLDQYTWTSWMPDSEKRKAEIRNAIKSTGDLVRIHEATVDADMEKYDAVDEQMEEIRLKVLEEEGPLKEFSESYVKRGDERRKKVLDAYEEMKEARGPDRTKDDMLALPEDHPERIEYERYSDLFDSLRKELEHEIESGPSYFEYEMGVRKRIWNFIGKQGTEKTDVELLYSRSSKYGSKMQHIANVEAMLESTLEASAHGKKHLYRLNEPEPNSKYGSQGRAYYRNQRWQSASPEIDHDGDVFIKPEAHMGTYAHEIGHGIEFGAGVGDISKSFALHQSDGRIKHLGDGYDADEVYLPDHLIGKYSSKWYPHNASEVVSSGVEHLFGDPIGFAKKAPEHFKYTIAVLRGDIRPDGKQRPVSPDVSRMDRSV